MKPRMQRIVNPVLAFLAGMLGGSLGNAFSIDRPGMTAPLPIETQEIRLVNSTGMLRGLLRVDEEGGPFLYFFDRNNNKRLELSLRADMTPALRLYGSTPQYHAGFELLPNDTANLSLSGSSSTLHIKTPDTGGSIKIYTNQGQPNIDLVDRNGGRRSQYAVWPNGQPALKMWDDDREIELGFLQTGPPALTFRERNGSVLWSNCDNC